MSMLTESPITVGKALRAFYAFNPSREASIEEVYRAKIKSYYDIVAAFWNRTGLGYAPEPPPINQEVWKIVSGNGMLCYLPKSDETYELLNSLFPHLGIKKAVEKYGIVDVGKTQNPGWFDIEVGTYQPHRWIANGKPASEDEVLTMLNKKARSPATLAQYIAATLFERAVFGNRLPRILPPNQTLLMGSKTNEGESIIGRITNGILRINSNNKDSVPDVVNIRSVKTQF